MIKKKIGVLLLYALLGILTTIYVFGFNHISLTNSHWLSAHDMTADLISWKYYSNDIWRFPIGNNPNYGMDIASGIVFSGSIPLLAAIFKLVGNFTTTDFHYFGLWIFICFFLQSYVSFLIIRHYTKNLFFSIIGSLFFLLSPILFHRIVWHLALAGHWLILLGFYIETISESGRKTFYWILLISLSALIHFYFTIILLGMFFLFVLNENLTNFDIQKLTKKIFITFSTLLITMYIFGYFEVPYTDALGFGYGHHQLNLTSIINPISATPNENVDWSILLPKFLKGKGGEIEGFSYMGMGGIFLLLIGIFYFFFSFNEFKKKKYRPYILIVILFSLVALSNRISLGSNLLFEFSLPKFIYGILSIIRASGRLFWPVYYLIFLGSILIIHSKFSKKKSLYILIFLLFLQVSDISSGLRNYFNTNAFKKNSHETNFVFWKKLSKEFPVLRTTYLQNETHLLMPMRPILVSQNFKSTDIATHGRYNRKVASVSRAKLYKSFDEKIIEKNTIFVIDNKNHLRNLKYLFQNKNVGFFYRDNVWIMVLNKKNEMTELDKKQLKNYEPVAISKNNKIIFNFKDEKSIHGLGWTHNFLSGKPGIWTEGNISSLLFRFLNNEKNDYLIKIKLGSLITQENNPINFSINVDNLFIKKFSLRNINELNNNSIEIKLKKKTIKNDAHYIKFNIDNPVTPLDLFQSPDARKLGILVESIEISDY